MKYGVTIYSCLMYLGVALLSIPNSHAQEAIVADHTIVEKYKDIPAFWIEKVKSMWVDIPGESHSSGYRIGVELLETLDNRFSVNRTESGTPEGFTDKHLRISRATWTGSGWAYSYGEEDWYTNSNAIQATKNHITYANTHNLEIAAFGFGWCWDMTWHNSPGGTIDPVYQVRWAGSSVDGPEGDLRWGLDAEDKVLTGNSVSMDTYLNATQQYIDHVKSAGYSTKVFFTTGPVDGGGNTGESGYQRHLKHERIRDYVRAHGHILFDYADILCWDDGGNEKTVSWQDHGGTVRTYQYIHPDNMLDLEGNYVEDGDHIGERGAVRLAKALWWMLARIAGWDGRSTGHPTNDFDGDAITDTTVWRTATGVWYYRNSDTPNSYIAKQWGISTDIPVASDYDGDGYSDIAVWRPIRGVWYIRPSGSAGTYSTVVWGKAGDIPAPADYDGDGKTDCAVWRPDNGLWYILPSGSPGNYSVVRWGLSLDIPVPGDYDGDGKADVAVYRPNSGVWYYLPSISPDSFVSTRWGMSSDRPVPGDYDGDGKADIAVWRPSSGIWYRLLSGSGGSFSAALWGVPTDTPAPGDYDGDGKIDVAVWRSSTGSWYVLPSATPGTYLRTQWGRTGDIPISAATGILGSLP